MVSQVPTWLIITVEIQLPMAKVNRPNILEWFKQNYPKEFDLAMEVNQRMGKILGQTEIPNPDFITAPVKLEVTRSQQDSSKLQLVANDYGLIYIGTIVKTIIDLLSTQFGGLSASAIGNEILDRKIKEVISQYFATQTLKKCPNCQSENRDDAKYCDNCGHKFNSQI
jgi:zinc-ribbon domain